MEVSAKNRRVTAARREVETVTPLELFFDLVFVLALTQCTALMAADPTWQGLARGLLVLSALWWSWVGYAWLTSVVDPEEGATRIAMFAAMALLLVAALAVPDAFGDDALVFALAYGGFRVGQIALFVIASRDEPELRSSVLGLALSTAIGVGPLVIASFTDGVLQGAIWLVALSLDMGGPLVIRTDGWQLMPSHFAERHGLIVIIALGESIVAIGLGAGTLLGTGAVVAAVLGIVVSAALWWLYFDVVAIVAEHKLVRAAKGSQQNSMARDSYSYLHFPMIAGIVLVALGLKKTLEHVGDPLTAETATALLGGAAVYLVAHIAFRLRNVGTLNRQRVVCAALLVALIPVATRIPALAALTLLAAVLVALITYEAIRFSEARDRVRHELARDHATESA